MRPVSVAAGLLLAAPASFGLPQGATPTFGQTTVKQTTPTQLDIRQTTPRAGIDWTRFSIAAGEKVVITQPGSSSVLLNRVVGNDPSAIYGQMQSNGSVWLINPRGIVFGANSRVDVGSLVASTLSITREDVASGRLLLGRGAGEPGELRSEGVINAPGGTVALIAPRITHTGSIDARRIGLAAASEVLVDVEGDGLIFFNARNDGLDTRLSVLGNVLANGGSVEARAVARAGFADTVLNLEGIVQARSLGERNGRIVIDGGSNGITRVAGTLDATGNGSGQRGGDVVVLGEKVLIDRGAVVDASGSTGGGQVRVGGDFQGKNPELANASMVTVMPGARLAANATGQGDGGRVIVWSDDATRFFGGVEARGGLLGGNGGFSEVSGKAYLDFQGTADLSAPLGTFGTLLLDPLDLTVVTGNVNSALLNGNEFGFGEGNLTGNSDIGSAAIVTLLATANVSLQASRDITVNAAIPAASSGTFNLELRAGNNISVNEAITVRGNLRLSTNDPGTLDTTIGTATTGSVSFGSNGALTAGAAGVIDITNNGGTSKHVITGAVTAPTINLTGSTDLGNGASLTAASGSTAVNVLAGTLDLGAVNRIASTARVDLATGTTLNLPNANQTIGALSGSGSVALGNRDLTTGSAASTTFSGVISGSGDLIKAGTSTTFTLSGINTYGGNTNVSGGTLAVSGSGKAGDGTGTIAIANGATLDILSGATLANAVTIASTGGTIDNSAGAGTLSGGVTLNGASNVSSASTATGLTLSGVISGGSALTKIGGGTVTLTRTNTYSGATNVNAGTLAVQGSLDSTAITVGGTGSTLSTNADNLLSNTAVVNVNTGGTLTLGGSQTIGSLGGSGGTVELGANALTTGAATNTGFAGVITGTGGSLIKEGNGTFTLTGTSTYTGGTTVNDGTLAVSGSAGRAGATAGAITLTSGTTLNIISGATVANAVSSTGGTIANSTGDGTLSGNLTLVSPSTVSSVGNGLAVSGDITGGFTLTKAGTGTVTLSGANTYGSTTVSAGTLAVSGGSAIPDASAVSISGTATLQLAADETIGSLTGPAGSGVDLGGHTLTTGTTTSTTFAGAIIGASGSGLVKVGSGNFTLSGANTYTGTTRIDAGTLTASNGSAIPNDSAVTLANATGVTLALSGSETIGSLVGGGSNGGTVTLGNNTLTTGSAGSTTFDGIISGSNGVLTKVGGSTFTLTGINTYGGNTNVNGGTLAVSGSGKAGDGTGTIAIANGATLDIISAATLANAVTIASTGGTIGNSAGAGTLSGDVTLNGASNLSSASTATGLTLSGAIGGGSALTKIGGGTVTLGSANTYSGATSVSAGTLAVQGTLASADITVGGTGSILSTNAADLLLNTADVTVNTGGTLTLGGSDRIGSLGGSGGTVALGANALTTGASANTSFAGVINGTGGSLTKLGSGTFTLTGTSNYTGGTTVSAGTLSITGSGAAGTGTITVGNNGTLDIGGSATVNNAVALNGGTIGNSSGLGTLSTGGVTLGADSSLSSTTAGAGNGLTISAGIGGPFDLTKVGAGAVTLSGINSHVNTTISAGTLTASSDAAIPDTSAVSLATGATLALQSNQTIGSLSGTGGTVTLGANTLTTGGTGNTSYAGAISGTNGALVKAGTGNFTLSGINTYTGTTIINAGTLTASTDAALPDGSAVVLANVGSAALALSSVQTIGSLAGGGTVTLSNANALTVGGNNTSTNFSGAIGGGDAASSLVKQGTGTLTLSGANTYVGSTSVGAGVLRAASNGALGAGSGITTVNTGAALELAGGLALTEAITLNGTGIGGTGALRSSGNNAVNRTITLASDSRINSDLGVLVLSPSSGSAITGTNANLSLGGNDAITVSAPITTNSGGVTKDGSGLVELAGASTYTGATTVNAGTLEVQGTLLSSAFTIGGGTLRTAATQRLADTAAVTLNTGVLLLGGAETIGSLTGSGGTVSLGANALTTGDATNTGFAGVITGTGGSLTKQGGGTFTLTGNSSYTGGTTVNDGTLAISGSGAAGIGAITVGSSGTLDIRGGANVTNAVALNGGSIGNSSGLGTLATGGVTLGADSTIGSTLAGASNGLTLNAAISGAFELTKVGAGTVTLGGSNSHANTAINAGTLAISGAGTGGSGTLTVAAGTVLDIINGATVSNAVSLAGGTLGNSANAGTLSGAGVTLTAASTLSSGGSGLDISANISGSGGITKEGGGAVTLSGSNSYTGSTTVNAGRLALASAAAVPAGSAVIMSDTSGALLDVQVDTTIGSLAGGGALGGNVALGANTLTAGSDNTSTTYGGRISGLAGRLAKAGGGTLTLTGNSSYDGDTEVSAGTLALGTGGVAGTGTIGVASGATLDIRNSVAVNNAVRLDGGTLANSVGGGTLALGGLELTANSTLNSSAAGLTITADISGSGGFTKTGSGALALGGNNVYAGATTINGGAVTVSGGNGIGDASAVTLANSGSVSLTLLAGETIGSLAGGGAAGGNVALNANTLVTGGNNGTTTYAGVISGGGGLTKAGSGNFTLSGANAYTGITTVNAGTLTLQGGAALANNAAVALADVAGATLALADDESIGSLSGGGTNGGDVALGTNRLTVGGNNTSTSFAGVISGSGGALTKSGTGTLTLSGDQTYTGDTTVAAGVLALQGTLASTTVNVNAGSLTTSGPNLLANSTVLTVADGSSMTLGGNDTIRRLALAGTLNGIGNTLTATDTVQPAYTLNGGTANANLGTGRLVAGGSSRINGSSGSLDVTVSSGTLTLGAGSDLANTADVSVSNGATLALGGDDTIGTLTLAGTLAGTGNTLTATTYTLDGATVLANLGTGTLTSTGTTTLTGTADASEVTVSSGQMIINAAERLSNNSLVNVLTGADLRLNFDETIGSLNLTGTTSGPGSLSASNFALNNATYNGNLGTGDLVSNGISRINGSAGSVTLLVNTGTLTLAGSGSMTATPDVTVNDAAALVLLRNERFGSLAGGGDVTLGNPTAVTLSTGSRQSTSFSGVISGPGNLVKEGAGTTFTLTGANTYTGATTVSAGTLALGGANVLGATAVAVATGATLQLGGNDTVSGLDLGGTLTGSGTLTAATYNVAGGNTTVNAALGGGTLNSTLASRLAGSAAAGTVNVDSGTLTLVGAGRFTAAPALEVDAGATIVLGGNETTGTLSGGGTVALGTRTLTTGAGGASTFGGVISGSGGLTKLGNSVFTLSGANTYTGATTVNAGTLALSGTNRLSNGTTVSVASGATLALGGTDTVAALNLDGLLAGNGTLTAASYNLDGGRSSAGANLGVGTLTSTGASTLGGSAAAGIVDVVAGSLTLASADRLADNARVTIAAGAALQLTDNDTVGSLTASGTLGGSGTLSATTYTLDGATINANLGGGTLASTGDTLLAGVAGATSINVNGGVLTLASANRLADGAAVAVAAGARLVMNGSDTVGSLQLAGTLQGAGTLTALTYSLNGGQVDAVDLGAGTLVSAGESLLGSRSAATVVNVDSGRLTLADAGALTATPALTVGGGATLALGGNEAVGSLAGAGSVALGAATLTTGSGASSRFDGVISGSGGLIKQGASIFTLGGANTYTGATAVNAGTLALASANRLANGTDVTVASGATLQLTGNDTVGTLALAGTLAGSGTLTATSYTLASANVVASLGSGSLVSTGDTTLAGSSSASTVAVDSGTLTLGGASRLANTAALSVADGASVVLTGSDTIGSLALAGTLSGNGTLTAATYALDGGAVNAALGSGALTSTGASTLTAASAARTVAVDGGSLTLAGNGRFTAAPVTTVAGGSTLALGSSQTLGSLAGDGNVALGSTTLSTGAAGSTTFGGVLSGTGKLFKQGGSTFTLAGDNTYTGSTTVAGGTLAVDGTLASGAVAVNAGSLVLGAANRLADGAALSVADGATLTLGGSDRVASLVLAGTLDGSGTLTAATYALNGGSASANLGAGTLTSTGSSVLAGTSAAGTVAVDSGTLSLASADRLSNGAAVTVASGARLRIDGNDTIGSLALSGTLDGSGVLTAATYRLAGGTANANLGGGALTSTGSSTLAGVSAADSVRVEGGTLTLLSPDRGIGGRFSATPAVNVAGGSTLALGGNETFGTLAGSGTVTLGGATLSTGIAGSSTFAGTITGSGALTKQGSSTFTLTGANTYTGVTTVEAGTLSLGNGGGSGSLATSAYVLAGALRVNRSDAVTLAARVSGSGSIEQAGSGTLTFSGGNKSHSGRTLVSGGALATRSGGDLSENSAVTVAAGANLSLAGAESIPSIDAEGAVSLGGDLATTSGDLRLAGATSVVDNRAITLSGANIRAVNDGNRWGSRLSIASTGSAELSSGIADGKANDLLLGSVAVGNGGRIEAGKLALDGNLSVSGGNLQLVAMAAQAITAPSADMKGKLASALPIAFAEDVVTQSATSAIDVAEGARLAVVAPSGGSVQLTSEGNRFAGLLSVRSGGQTQAWEANPTRFSDGLTYALQGRVRINGSTVNIGPGNADVGGQRESLAGVEADLVEVRADRLTTAAAAGENPRATIVARLPFDNTVGTEQSLPGLTLELSPVAFTLPFPFGLGGDQREVNINVGNRAFGDRTLPLDSGYLRVLPRGGAQGSTVVILSGPSLNTGYQFFFDGAGQVGEIPVFYNGSSPSTPQLSGSISAIVSVTESARRERFEEAVRTENVAVRLRAGVIAEVGPGRPATQGSEGAKPPTPCAPVDGGLSCSPQP